MPREHEPANAGEQPATGGREVSTRELVRHLAITETAMVRTQQSAARLALITAGCQVSDRRARRLIKAVNMLWHYRAQAFGTPSKARTKILPLVTNVYERALSAGNMTAALGALRLQAELCGLSKQDVAAMPVGEHDRTMISAETEAVSKAVLDRLLRHGLNGGSNGNGRSLPS